MLSSALGTADGLLRERNVTTGSVPKGGGRPLHTERKWPSPLVADSSLACRQSPTEQQERAPGEASGLAGVFHFGVLGSHFQGLVG